jgi:oxygen-independent coproporphyrinogen-3 oxidase
MNLNQPKYMHLLEKAEKRIQEMKILQAAGLICHDGDFVPSVHYPPITQYPLNTQEELFSSYTPPEDGLIDIYVHLPFCERRCLFCHYPGKLGEQAEEKTRYLAALEKEMDIYLNVLGIDKIKPRSILIGGGTPTFLPPKQLAQFLEFFSKRVDYSRCRQFNYDVDPGTLVGEEGLERLRIMKEYGVNRLTIGVQSLNDDILKLMNRPHGSDMAIESIDNCANFGFGLNIEFIFGHPGQTLENWIEVVEKAVTLPVDEIQLYRLKVLAYGDLQGSILKIRQRDTASIPSFEDTMRMKQLAIDILAEHGFNENLRRVYSKEKKNYSHYAYNQCCMLYDQIGFGLTAFSSMRDRFGLNTQNFDEYYAAIEQGRLPLNRGYIRDMEQQARWATILPLKNRDIIKKQFEKVTGGLSFDKMFRKKISQLKKFGLIEDTATNVRLTELGAFVADEVVEEFNANEFMPFPSKAYAQGPLHPYADNTTEEAFGIGSEEISDDIAICELVGSNPVISNVQNKQWELQNLTDEELKQLLTATGDLQQKLFTRARAVRKEYMGDNVRFRGVIEISNFCQKNCDYCAMRYGNKSLERFRLDAETILNISWDIVESGIKVVFLQAGQDPHIDSILEQVIPIITNEMGAEVLLCVGEKDKETYQQYTRMGAKSFIMKFETSDPVEHKRITHATLEQRMQHMHLIREAGMQIGTGNIIGLPGLTLDNLISDLRLIYSFKPDFASTAPFIANNATPMEGFPAGDMQIALNMIAMMRIGLKECLIPAVSALECTQSGGQLLGLNAGANVLTINFTPKSYRENYKIYSKDRFIVNLTHAQKTAVLAGMRANLVLQPA